MPGWSFLEDDQLGRLVEFEVSFLCVLFHVCVLSFSAAR